MLLERVSSLEDNISILVKEIHKQNIIQNHNYFISSFTVVIKFNNFDSIEKYLLDLAEFIDKKFTINKNLD